MACPERDEYELAFTAVEAVCHYVRDAAADLLEGRSHLSMDTDILQGLWTAFREVAVDSLDPRVITLDDSAREKVDCVYNIVRRVPGLKVCHRSKPGVNNINLEFFSSLCKLHLSKIPRLECVRGLANLRPQIEVLTVYKTIHWLGEILSQCGSDFASPSPWLMLRRANFSYNFISEFDESIALMPAVQVLDLSHNQIKSSRGVEELSKLQQVRLSYNMLTSIPIFSQSVSTMLTVLTLKHNYLESLSGIELLVQLVYLDASENMVNDICETRRLVPLNSLKTLYLEGNPVARCKRYRLIVACFTSHSVLSTEFMLDSVALDKKLVKAAELFKVKHDHSFKEGMLKPLFSEFGIAAGQEPSINQHDDEKQKSKRPLRLHRKREVVIEEPHGEKKMEVKPLLDESPDHLKMKNQIEGVRKEFGEDNWLHSQAGSFVSQLLGFPQESQVVEVIDSEILVTEAEVHCMPADPGMLLLEPESPSCQLEAEGEEEVPVDATHVNPSPTEAGQRFGSSSDEDNDDSKRLTDGMDVHDATYFVQWFDKENDHVILTISDKFIREKDVKTADTTCCWDVKSLQSFECVNASPLVIKLTFNTVKKAAAERLYVIQEEDLKDIQAHLYPVLEANTTETILKGAMQCLKCSAEFYHGEAIKKRYFPSAGLEDEKSRECDQEFLACPICGSDKVFELDMCSTPVQKNLNGSTDGTKLNESLSSTSTMCESSSIATASMCPDQLNARCMAQCASVLTPSIIPTHDVAGKDIKTAKTQGNVSASADVEHNIGSASSLLEANAAEMSDGHLKRDSDIEVISNPSQNSIEVLTTWVDKFCGGGDCMAQEQIVATSQEMRHPVLADDSSGSFEENDHTTNANLLHFSTPIASVRHREPLPFIYREQNSPEAFETPGSSLTSSDYFDVPCVMNEYDRSPSRSLYLSIERSDSFASSAQSMSKDSDFDRASCNQRQTLQVKLEASRPEKTVFSYTKFDDVDHRLRLHFCLNLFHGDEEFASCLRAEVLMPSSAHMFPGLLVMSSTHVYVLRIIDDNWDKPNLSLERVNSYLLKHLHRVFITAGKHAIAMEFNRRIVVAFVLMDSARVHAYLRHFSDIVKQNDLDTTIIDCVPEQLSSVLKHLESCGNPQHGPVLNMSLCFASVGSQVTSDLTTMVITNSHVILFGGDIRWILSPSESPVVMKHCQPVGNLVGYDPVQDKDQKATRLNITFHDEDTDAVNKWQITTATSDALDVILKALRKPWEDMFQVSFGP